MSSKEDDTNKIDEILTYQPLSADNAVSANPHIPSVSASAVLGESESVSSCIESAMLTVYLSLCTSYVSTFEHIISYTYHTLIDAR